MVIGFTAGWQHKQRCVKPFWGLGCAPVVFFATEAVTQL
jgi:hypothetical protein